MPDNNNINWFATVRDYTKRLVNIRSVSPGIGENLVAQEVLRILHEGGLEDVYTSSGLDPLRGDPYGRCNVYAFLRGQSEQTLVLLGHIDTVDTQDYGPLEPWALDPDELALREERLVAMVQGLQADLAAHPNDWMYGRGSCDMKSGVAINIAIMRYMARKAQRGELPLSVVILATPDEENESAGVLQAVPFLLKLQQEHGLSYVGAINTDYTTARYPDDPHRYVFTGSAGKMLPSFLVIGRESHVGDPFDGIDANLLAAELIRDLSMNDALCDTVRGQITPPPVTLHSSDLKAHYDAQLPFMAHFYLNVLTFTTTPDALLETLTSYARASMARALQRIDEAETRWKTASGLISREQPTPHEPRTGIVITYAELYREVTLRLGQDQLAAALDAEWERWPAEMDKRERSLHHVRLLWALSGRQGPAVVLSFSPPFYPHVAATPCALHEAVAATVAAHRELNFVQEEFFPFLSDMSYLRLDANVNPTTLKTNMPLWEEPDTIRHPGSYSLPLAEIQRLNLPVVNFGPYGKGAHQRGERVLMSYSFGTLPELIVETIERLVEKLEGS